MDKHSNFWFAAIYATVFTCYIGIFYPTTSQPVAVLGGAIATIFLGILFYILYK